MSLDYDYARSVIMTEAEAIRSMVRVVNGSFAAAAEIILQPRVRDRDGRGRRDHRRKIRRRWRRRGRRAIFCTQLGRCTATWAACVRGRGAGA